MLCFPYDPTVGSIIRTNRIKGSSAAICLATSLAASVAAPSAAQIQRPGEWAVVYEAGSKEQTLICLARAKTSKKQSGWTAEVRTEASVCEEFLRVDLAKRRLYLAVEAAVISTPTLDDEYCPPFRASTIYTACTSSFFDPIPERPNFRRLNRAAVKQAIETARIVGFVEGLAKAREDALEAEWQVAYERDFSSANTARTIAKFRRTYATKDPKARIPELSPRFISLQRTQFSEANTINELREFVSMYGDDDPAGLLPAARRSLAKLEAAQAAQAELDRLTFRIQDCRATIIAAERAIARERQIERVSGAVNLNALHAAGEQLVRCQEAIPIWYATYQRKGGKRPLASIN